VDRPLTDGDRLPVEDVVGRLRTDLAAGQVALLVAPPGSGKSTIAPLRLLDEPWLDERRILLLEPRRLATRATARRMADLLSERVGETVGYVTRDERRVSAATRIEVVTEGILTRRLQHDPELPGVGLVIFDEFHERNLQTDLGLALTVDVLQSLRPDLRVLLMSATIDAERIADALNDHLGTRPPVITSESRQYPIDVRYAGSLSKSKAGGDVLVFLPGMGEIVRTHNQLADEGALAEIHRLHGSLPLDEQATALAPAMRRKVVLSTDIAETSLTVEGRHDPPANRLDLPGLRRPTGRAGRANRRRRGVPGLVQGGAGGPKTADSTRDHRG